MIDNMTRRAAIGLGALAVATPFVLKLGGPAKAAPAVRYQVTMTPAQWQAKLGPAAYNVAIYYANGRGTRADAQTERVEEGRQRWEAGAARGDRAGPFHLQSRLLSDERDSRFDTVRRSANAR